MLKVEIQDTESNLIDSETCGLIKDLVTEFVARKFPVGAKLLEDYRIDARLVARDDRQQKPEGLRTLAFTAGEEIHLFITDFWRDQTICEVVRTPVEPAKETCGVGQIAIVLPTKVRKVQPLIVRENPMTSESSNDKGMTVDKFVDKLREKTEGLVRGLDGANADNREHDTIVYRIFVDESENIPPDFVFAGMFWGTS
ncbi:MAG: hypothetical protein KAU31_11850, partial [Spirochaetaceae bacterium]|nr:hypothetical protein [Spirochaetaceae bacterium]